MSLVNITNIKGGTFSFTLYHSVFCEHSNLCNCSKDEVLRPIDGGLKYHTVISPKSIYLEPAASVTLPEAVLKIPQVAEAKRRGILQVKKLETQIEPVGGTT